MANEEVCAAVSPVVMLPPRAAHRLPRSRGARGGRGRRSGPCAWRRMSLSARLLARKGAGGGQAPHWASFLYFSSHSSRRSPTTATGVLDQDGPA